MRILVDLFTCFFKMGLFTFGGGYAMLPLLQKEIVEDRAWASEEELLDYYAIGQTTPGIIAVNTATFIGEKQAGIKGAIVAVLGLIAPSILVISFLSGALEKYHESAAVAGALAGIRIAVSALIFMTVIKMAKSAIKDRGGLFIFVIALLLILVFSSPIVLTVFIGAGLGLLLSRRQNGNS